MPGPRLRRRGQAGVHGSPLGREERVTRLAESSARPVGDDAAVAHLEALGAALAGDFEQVAFGIAGDVWTVEPFRIDEGKYFNEPLPWLAKSKVVLATTSGSHWLASKVSAQPAPMR